MHPSQRHWRAERRKNGFCCHPDAPLLWFLIGRKTIKRFTSIRLPAGAAVPRSAEDVVEQISRNGDLGHLEGDVAAMPDDLCADLNEFLLQGRRSRVLLEFPAPYRLAGSWLSEVEPWLRFVL